VLCRTTARRGRGAHHQWQVEERRVNLETFGQAALQSSRGSSRGGRGARGRGGRGGRGTSRRHINESNGMPGTESMTGQTATVTS